MAKGGCALKIPIDKVIELLVYCPETGVFRRNGNIAGYKNKQGYIIIGVNEVQYRAHRIAWAISHGDTDLDIDHIDGDTTNNKISNKSFKTMEEAKNWYINKKREIHHFSTI